MKNISELRIGNYIEVTGEVSKVEGVIKYGVYFAFGYCPNENDWIKPIELTEEWLLKLPKELIYPEWIKYLHELQNWYYWNNEKKELHINL